MSLEPPTEDLPLATDLHPLLRKGAGPLGLPELEAVDPQEFQVAFDQAAEYQWRVIEEILAQPGEPSLTNTVVPFETSRLPLRRLQGILRLFTSAVATDDVLAVWATLSPRISAHLDAVHQDHRLWQRLEHVPTWNLNPQDAEHLRHLLRSFTRAGAGLEPALQAELAEVGRELALDEAEFSRRLLADSVDLAVVVEDEAELDGLTPKDIALAKHIATNRGRPEAWVIPLMSPTQQPFLSKLRNPDLRARLFGASLSRGSRGNAWDTRELVTRITANRAVKASLLGFASYADFAVDAQSAGSTGAVGELLGRLLEPAIAKAQADMRALETFAGFRPGPADVQFWLEEYRRYHWRLDPAEYQPYFELESVLVNGVFHAAERLYGVTMHRLEITCYHPDVRVYEARDADGSPLGLVLLDLFSRPTKLGGAWMDQLVEQSQLVDALPIVTLNTNIAKPAAGVSAHLTLDETRGLFHEFGHVLHGLFSSVIYPSDAGTNVPRDAVEYPSQFNESLALRPEIVAHYARQDGRPLPEDLRDRLEAAEYFGASFGLVEMLSAVMLDLTWHALEDGEVIEDVLTFESEVLQASGAYVDFLPPRYRTPYFAHVMGNDYAASYYSYLWSEAFEADTLAWFEAQGGLSRAAGDAFRETILAPGNSRDLTDSFRMLTGHPVSWAPLLRRFGLVGAEDSDAA